MALITTWLNVFSHACGELNLGPTMVCVRSTLLFAAEFTWRENSKKLSLLEKFNDVLKKIFTREPRHLQTTIMAIG